MLVRRILLTAAVILMLAIPVLAQNSVVDGDFEAGDYGWWHWWPYSPWNCFTILPDDYGNPTYIYRDGGTGPSGLPNTNGFPGVEWISGWNPTSSKSAEYNMTPYADYSAGYANPQYVGWHWLKKNPGNNFYSGSQQTISGLTPGVTYVVSAYGTSSAISDAYAADMRILVDPNGGTVAMTAPIRSAAVPNRPGGRYWLWSSTGNNRIGTIDDTKAADVTGFYQMYDKVSVQFTATKSSASIFMLMDWTKYNSDYSNGIGIGWDNVTVTPVPEPSSLLALGSPLALAAGAFLRRRKA